ncbi:MAG TPA: TonB-dependent receptor [Steroidobacteraceae bacterium]|nr:TonB-dependent receptor [Steroidobacteraceae bacterium]
MNCMSRAALAALALCATSMVAGAQETGGVPAAHRIDFHIARETVGQALNEVGQQSGLSIVVAPAVPKSLMTSAVSGRYTPEEVLRQLLAPVGLQAQFLDNGTVVVRFAGAVGDDVKRETDSRQLEEVVVTGSLIRGIAPAGPMLKVYTREEIEEAGAGSLAQFTRVMPENFADTDPVSNNYSNAHFGVNGQASLNNAYNGTAFNLHGLGAGSTLTLLDGHRLPAAGADGSFTDVSLLPLAVIDRVEVLNSGASAIYGSDAVGGVVNIITRQDFEGAESRLRYGTSTSGGAASFTGSQLAGTRWDSGNLYANYEYTWNGGLDANQRDYIASLGGPYTLLPRDHRSSGFLAGRQELGNETTLSGRALYSDRWSFAAQSVQSAALDASNSIDAGVEQSGGTLSIEHPLGAAGRVSLTGSYAKLKQTNRTDSAYSFGLMEQIAGSTVTRSSSVDALADGEIAHLRGGAVKGAVGASYRSEALGQSGVINGEPLTALPSLQRRVASAYTEVFVPLFGPANARNYLRRLELSIAARYDHYSDFGSTVNPELGLAWSPSSAMDLHGTFGRSYRAPTLFALGSAVSASTYLAPNPAAPGGLTDLLTIGGGNPGLGPERATTYSGGIVLHPQPVPNLSLSLDYFNIVYRSQVATPPEATLSGLFSDPVLAPFLNLHPDPAQVAAYFNSPNFGGDAAGLGPGGVAATFDGRYANIALSRQSGVNLGAGYEWPVALGVMSATLNLNRMLYFDLRTTTAAPPLALLDTFGEPVRTRGRAALAWRQGGLSAALSANYTGGYRNTLFVPDQSIDQWVTCDLHLGYAINAGAGIVPLRDVTVALTVTNLTDRRPPFAEIPVLPGQNFIPFDPTNSSPVGRLVALTLTRRW